MKENQMEHPNGTTLTCFLNKPFQVQTLKIKFLIFHKNFDSKTFFFDLNLIFQKFNKLSD